jgi:hypothetical protein
MTGPVRSRSRCAAAATVGTEIEKKLLHSATSIIRGLALSERQLLALGEDVETPGLDGPQRAPAGGKTLAPAGSSRENRPGIPWHPPAAAAGKTLAPAGSSRQAAKSLAPAAAGRENPGTRRSFGHPRKSSGLRSAWPLQPMPATLPMGPDAPGPTGNGYNGAEKSTSSKGETDMRSIPKPLLLSAVATSLLLAASSARADVDFGLRGGVYSDASDPFAGVELLAPIGHSLYFNPNFEYVFVDHGDFFTLNFDAHYDFWSSPSASVWLGAGAAVLYTDPGGPRGARNGDSQTDFGLNLLAGIGARRGPLRPYLQGKVIVSDDSQAVIAVGIRFP